MIFLGSDVADDSKVSEAILMLLDLFLVWISTAFFSQTLCCLLFNGCNRLLFPISEKPWHLKTLDIESYISLAG